MLSQPPCLRLENYSLSRDTETPQTLSTLVITVQRPDVLILLLEI